MNGGLVSVVIPTYNYERFICDAIESVLAQTHPPYEIIVIDDGGQDSTQYRLAQYGDRVRYIHQSNRGVAAARNAGIRAAGGDWIALLDADDVWHPRKLEIQMSYLSQHPDVALVAAESHVGESAPMWSSIDPRSISGRRVSLENIIVRPRFSPSSTIIRARCFREIGGFDESFGAASADDRDMWIRIARAFVMAKLNVQLSWTRLHGNNASNAARRMEQDELRVLDRAFAQLAPEHARWPLRRKAYSHAAFSAAYMYREAGYPVRAIARVLHSLLLWPLPFGRGEVPAMVRLKVLAVTSARLLQSFATRPYSTANRWLRGNSAAANRLSTCTPEEQGPWVRP